MGNRFHGGVSHRAAARKARRRRELCPPAITSSGSDRAADDLVYDMRRGDQCGRGNGRKPVAARRLGADALRAAIASLHGPHDFDRQGLSDEQ